MALVSSASNIDVVAAFARGKRVPVVVTINGDYQYRNTIASMGGQF